MINDEIIRTQMYVQVLEHLKRYKAHTELQKERLLQGDVEGALQLMEEKEQILSEIERDLRENRDEEQADAGYDSLLEAMVQGILALNNEVVALMGQQRNRIAAELKKFQHGRQTKHAYQARYTPHAYFFDKRK
jgi:Zn-dependent M32 family carboxypeptidase